MSKHFRDDVALGFTYDSFSNTSEPMFGRENPSMDINNKELPVQFRSWLDFYEGIKSEAKSDETLFYTQCKRRFTFSEIKLKAFDELIENALSKEESKFTEIALYYGGSNQQIMHGIVKKISFQSGLYRGNK